MLVTVVPASAKTGVAIIRSLFAKAGSDIEIRAVYRNIAKAPREFTSRPNFRAVQGDIADASSLDFQGSDVVVTITPHSFEGGDIVALAESYSQNVKKAVEASGTVKKLVLLSSVGAQFSTGVGEIKTNNAAERVFATTSANVPEIIFVRCAYFMENWTASLDTLKAEEPFFFSTVTPLDWKLPMIAVKDIGSTLAREALKDSPSPKRPYVFELHGPRQYTPEDTQKAFTKAMGKHVEVKAIPKEELPAFLGQVFPPDSVGEWVEMAMSFLPGGVMKPGEVEEGTEVENGETELDDAIKEAVGELL